MTRNRIRNRLHEIIFEADTRTGKVFDIILLILILMSVAAVLLESVPSINPVYYRQLRLLEWFITIVFTIEYFLRIWIVNKPKKYMTSFFGIIDFLSILPTYIGLLITGTQSLLVIRALRLLRVFRVLKITRYTSEGGILMEALKASRVKISVFLFAVLTLILIIGTIMYLIEGAEHGFVSIPKSIYWAVVTLTTVGYGDITPQTALGQFLSAAVMILGYAIIAVPTGIVSMEISSAAKKQRNTQVCQTCLAKDHDNDARFCKHCGSPLYPNAPVRE
ncbi:MAG: ion transporter [Bacteroidota bacterium]